MMIYHYICISIKLVITLNILGIKTNTLYLHPYPKLGEKSHRTALNEWVSVLDDPIPRRIVIVNLTMEGFQRRQINRVHAKTPQVHN